jgi:hypothetical protein
LGNFFAGHKFYYIDLSRSLPLPELKKRVEKLKNVKKKAVMYFK